MTLRLLTETEAQEFIASLDLAKGSEAQRTLGAMMLLPADAFIKALSAVAQGLIDFHSIRSLPAMNERLVEGLIMGRLGSSDPTTLAWRYREEWLPATIDMVDLKRRAIGNAREALSARYIDRWGYVIRPNYDFIGVDETRYHTYNEAYVAYMAIAHNKEVSAHIERFDAATRTYAELLPTLISNDPNQNIVLKLIRSMRTSAHFLERATGTRPENKLLDWIMSRSWLTVEPSNYTSFLEYELYPTLADHDEPSRVGIDAVKALYDKHQWTFLSPTRPGWDFDRVRMARVFLPQSYGFTDDYESEVTTNAHLTQYVSEAHDIIKKIHEYISDRMSGDATGYRKVSGSPFGLLLSITYTRP